MSPCVAPLHVPVRKKPASQSVLEQAAHDPFLVDENPLRNSAPRYQDNRPATVSGGRFDICPPTCAYDGGALGTCRA